MAANDAGLGPQDYDFGALHAAIRRDCAFIEACKPSRRVAREMAEEAMHRVGMVSGICDIFMLSTASEALASPANLAWFAANERRLKAGDWPRRVPAATPVAVGRLVADLIWRWVEMPQADEERMPATCSEAVGAGARRDSPPHHAPQGPQRSDSLATEVVFTFGDAAWLQRLRERYEVGLGKPARTAAVS